MAEIKQYLPQRFAKLGEGTFMHALSIAVDEQHTKIQQQIQACIDQFFLTTASGQYLVRLGEQEGFVMPANSGLDIRAYRVLVPLMVSSPKQVKQTFGQIIEAFYGADRTRPSLTATVAEPYNLSDGDNIRVLTEKGITDVAVLANQVADISNVTSAEIAARINSVQNQISADIISDRITGNKSLRLMSTTIGVMSFIRVVGGTLQNIMQFPEVISSAQGAGTNWVFTKEQVYTDVLKIQWDGTGTNPKLYLVKQGDILTVRGLSGTILSELNGSYEILDSGYDYVVVRNSLFDQTSATYTQVTDDDFVFTSQRKITIYDNPEYGMATETDYATATVTVPAIPPLARRFLSGAAHLHGAELSVADFTRNSITITVPTGTDKPAGENLFVIKTDRMVYDFRKPYYKTTDVDLASPPNYIAQSYDPNYSALPFTDPSILPSDSLYMQVGTDDLVITFPFPHGMCVGWELNLSGCTGIANMTPTLLNQPFVVKEVVSSNQLICKMREKVNTLSIGNPILFEGVNFGPFDAYRYATMLDDGSDFYLEFPSVAAVAASGLEANTIFKVDPASGIDVNDYYTKALKHRPLYVTSISGTRVNIVSGLGAGYPNVIVHTAMGFRSSFFGGAANAYHFDKTSAWNTANVMQSLKACLLSYTQSSNPNYVGSFVYDPQGVSTLFTVSKYIVKLTDSILRGSNAGVIFVDTVTNVAGGHSFPAFGKILIEYGTDNTEGPINYIAVISNETGNSQIILDPSYRFTKSHGAGAQIQYIHATTPYVPGITGKDFPLYVTGTANARNTLFTLLQDLVAGGIFLQADVLLPQLRYQDPAIPPFS